METSDRPCGRNSRYLAFGRTGMGEARTTLIEGTEAGAMGSIIRAAGVGVKDRQRSIQRTAGYGPVCPVVWEGRRRAPPPYPDCAGSDSWNDHSLVGGKRAIDDASPFGDRDASLREQPQRE